MVTDDKLPIIQNVIASSFSRESTIYLIKPRQELNMAETMMPDNKSVMFALLPMNTVSSSDSSTAATPKKKELNMTAEPDQLNNMASAAPTQLPLVTPSKSGEINLLLNTL